MFDLFTCKIGVDKNAPKLLEKEKLQIYGIVKIVHDYCYIKLYSINTFSRKSLIGMTSSTKASRALLVLLAGVMERTSIVESLLYLFLIFKINTQH